MEEKNEVIGFGLSDGTYLSHAENLLVINTDKFSPWTKKRSELALSQLIYELFAADAGKPVKWKKNVI